MRLSSFQIAGESLGRSGWSRLDLVILALLALVLVLVLVVSIPDFSRESPDFSQNIPDFSLE
jgi:hypothetical protein